MATTLPARKTHLDALAVTLLLACCLFWGGQQVLIKITMGELPPVFQAAVRFAGAALLLMTWSRWRGVALWSRDGSLRAGLLAGALFAAEFACIYLALTRTAASHATVFVYTSPFWVALFLPLWVRSERLVAMQWLGLALAFAGLAVALWDGLMGSVAGVSLGGDLLALGGGMFWGLTTVVIRSTSLARVSPEKLLFYQVAVSTVTLPFLSLALGEAWPSTISPFGVTSLAIQTVIGAFASYLTWMWLLARYPATQMSVFVFLTPVFALGAAALFLRESITLNLIAGLAMVTAGIVLSGRKTKA